MKNYLAKILIRNHNLIIERECTAISDEQAKKNFLHCKNDGEIIIKVYKLIETF